MKEIKRIKKDEETPTTFLHEEMKASIMPLKPGTKGNIEDSKIVPFLKPATPKKIKDKKSNADTLFKYQLLLETLGSFPEIERPDIVKLYFKNF